jgi:glycosyltransferase involved in cell wall biosynthesis
MANSISIFFPCYNDSGAISSMVIKSFLILNKLGIQDREVIVIDDKSTDSSVEILENLQKQYPELKIIKHEENKGYGGALRSGFTAAKKEFVFYTDGDAQYNVNELEKLYKKLIEKDVDIVNGYKIQRHDPWHRIVIGKLYNQVVKLMFGIKIKDVDCDFRLMKRSVFNKIQLTQDSGCICVELVKKIQSAGFKFAEVPVHHYFRTHGKSQFFNFKRVFAVGIGLLKLWFELVVLKRRGANK